MSTQNLHTQHDHDEGSHVHRIGGVARLAGVAVSTLRMWESRHGAFRPGKTDGRHRLYTETDVARARLLRQLTDSGHSIGRIATLSRHELQQMLSTANAASPASPRARQPSRMSAVVIGSAIGARLQSPAWRSHLGGTVLDLRAVFMSLEEACTDEAAAAMRDADLLVVRLNAVPPSAVETLMRLKSESGLRNAVLLYNFGAQAAVATLRAAGFLVRREPVEDAELAELLRSTTWAEVHAPSSGTSPEATIPQRRFAEEELARIASAPSGMLCECPRHLADIIVQLASFEEYSMQCLNDSEEDARVHAQLRSVAGSARALFEDALALVIAHEAAKPAARPG